MNVFTDLAYKFKNLDIEDICKKIFSDEIISETLIKIIQDRLYKYGEDSENKKLKTDLSKNNNFYAEFTIMQKQFKNKIYEHVTLFETGEFYKSFKIKAQKKFISIIANFFKGEDHIYDSIFEKSYKNRQEFENKILNLSEDEFNFFIDTIFLDYFIQQIYVRL